MTDRPEWHLITNASTRLNWIIFMVTFTTIHKTHFTSSQNNNTNLVFLPKGLHVNGLDLNVFTYS